jgi:hypothetical protein
MIRMKGDARIPGSESNQIIWRSIVKNLKSLIVFAGIILLTALSACSIAQPAPTTSNTGESPSPSPSADPVFAKSAKLYDANDVFLGYCAKSDETGLTVYSSASYFYTLRWNGQIEDTAIGFTGPDGSGNPIYISSALAGYCFCGKTAKRAGNAFFSFKSVNADGSAASDASITAYRSFYIPSIGSITTLASDESLGADYDVYALVTIDRAAVGIPASITTPLKLIFED